MKVILNEPKTKNALSINMIKEINSVIDNLKTDKEIRMMTFESSESGHFCTGANLKEWIKMSEEETRNFVLNLRNVF